MHPLKLTQAFRLVSQRGRWAKGALLSVGFIKNDQPFARIGLRTRRGLKGAVKRNRLKRQLRGIIVKKQVVVRPGLDMVVVIHQNAYQSDAQALAVELRTLCQKIGALG